MFEKYINLINAREEALREPILEKTNKNEDFKRLVMDIYNYHICIMQSDGTTEDKDATNKYMRQLLVKGVETNPDIVADFIYDNAQELAVPLMTYASTRVMNDVSDNIWKKRNLKSKLDTEERFDTITDNILEYLNVNIFKSSKEDGDK